jgi:hypothetical protein
MQPATRTPEGEPNRCPICGHALRIEPSRPPGDAPCPHCGTLLWFALEPVNQKPDPAAASKSAPKNTRKRTPTSPQSSAVGPRVVLTAWQYGMSLLLRGETDAALALMQNVVSHKPDDVAQRRALRGIERQLHPKDQVEPPSEVLFEVWSEIRQAKRKRSGNFIDWETVDRAAEKGLAANPWDADLHLELGHACRARGHRGAARFAYQCAAEIAPDRADIRQCLAELLG